MGLTGASEPPGNSPAAAAMILDALDDGLTGVEAEPPVAPVEAPEVDVEVEADEALPPAAPAVPGPLVNVIPATSARREISFICASEARATSPSG